MTEGRSSEQTPARHPPWLKVRMPFGGEVHELKTLLGGLALNTVCQEAMCPNMGECWSHGVATFMILGDVCTRGCRYCAVEKGKPASPDLQEPQRVAEAVTRMKLKHIVITSVNRDDLEDGGAGMFASVIGEIRRVRPECRVEVLVPDFQGSEQALRLVVEAGPDVFGHNIETVPRLYRKARGGGKYAVSLDVLSKAKQYNSAAVTKTGLMLGLGEEPEEVSDVLRDVVERRVNILTLGQYLRPTRWHLPVARYYRPEEFEEWKRVGEELGFDHVESGPLVRSSYLADRQFRAFGESRPNSVLVDLA